MPNGTVLESSHNDTIAWTKVPPAATAAHVVPGLTSHSLVSIGVLCDNNCTATFNKDQVQIRCNDKLVLKGPRLPNGLWALPLNQSPPTQHKSNLALDNKTKQDLVMFLHAAAFSPVESTWIKAIQNGHFATWPGITEQSVKQYYTKSIATAKGHLKQSRQRKRKPMPIQNDNTAFPETNTAAMHAVYAAVIDNTTTPAAGESYSDLTGRFPITSNRGAQYIFVLYDYDSNAILVEAIKSRQADEILKAYTKLSTRLANRGFRIRLHKLDNEASTALKEYMTKEDVEYQLVPPHIHRRNAAERAIQTFKSHFIAGLASTDPDFPMQCWCRLLPQAEMTLNLLRSSRTNPRLSAYAQLEGAFNYNKTPLAPPGTRVVVHEKPSQRRTWAVHGIDGWYVGPAMEHYQCYKIYIPSTRAERIADTVEFFPHYVNMPRLSSVDRAIRAATELTHALRNPAPAAPFAKLSDVHNDALDQLATIFNSTIAPNQTQAVPIPAKAPASPGVDKPRYNLRSHKANAAITSTPPNTLSTTLPFAAPVIHAQTGKALEYRDLIKDDESKTTWLTSAANEFGRLAQGIGNRVKGTNTIFLYLPSRSQLTRGPHTHDSSASTSHRNLNPIAHASP